MPAVETSGNRVEGGIKAPWYSLSWDVAGRIGLLFLTLCALKLAMLVGFRKHLFETHWRISGSPYDWTNEAAFCLFVILMGVNLWQFARRCAEGGVQMVRVANVVVLSAGACFIFLTLHAGDKNYLYPVMTGTLSWWDLRWYLNMDFFFQPPFLAAWVFIYAGLYYGLARTKRGQLILYYTAVFAAAYTGLYLQVLMDYRNALLVADGMGIACILAGLRCTGSLNWLVMIQPWLWFAFLYLLFQSQNYLRSNSEYQMSPEFLTLAGWSVVLFAGLSVFAWRRKFWRAWLWLLPFAFASFLLLVNINYPGASRLQTQLFVGLTLPRYFLGEFFLAIVLAAAATLYRRWLPKGSLLWLDVISLLLILIALMDLRLSQIMGIRLDWQAIEFGADAKMIWRLVEPYLPELIFSLIVLMGLYAVLIGLWQRAWRPQPLQPGRNGWFLLILFLLMGVAGFRFAKADKAESQSAVLLVTTAPVFTRIATPVMDNTTFAKTTAQLGMQQITRSSSIPPTHAPRNLNVVLIFQESCYNKHLSLFDGKENTEPLLSQFTNRMELFPNFFSDFETSINARFATLAGLYPTLDYKRFTYQRVNVDSIFDVLHQNGYTCSVFDSEFADYSGFRDFLKNRGVDDLFDADTMPGAGRPTIKWGLREDKTLGAILAQIKQYSTNHQKFFLSYFPVAPHNPFDGTPIQFQKFPVETPGDFTPSYLNEVLLMDWVVASIVGELKDSGLLDNTLVIITNDHGELLGENGGPIGHGWAVTPQLANIPLIVMDPANPGYRVNDTIGSQVDLLPTILDLLGIALPQNQLYQGVSLYSAAAQNDRTIYLNSFQQYAVIKGRSFICGNRKDDPADAVLKTFAIVNDGAKTSFPLTNSLIVPPISEFDKFQENLLQNYSYYCQQDVEH